MPRNKFLRRTLPWLVAVAALAFLGNRAGHHLARAGYFRDADGAPRALPKSDVPGLRPPRPQPARAGEVEAAMKKLALISRDSPDLDSDWDAQAAVDRVLAPLTAEELAELYARLDASGDFIIGLLSRKVGARWVAMDPDAAVKAALAKSKLRGEYYAVSIFSDWARDHPEEAFAWLDAEGGDPAMARMKETCRANLVLEMVERDFTLAEDELAKMEAPAVQEVMENWGHMYVEDAAVREKLIRHAKASGDPGDFAALNRGLMRSWPENDPLGLLNHIQDLRDYLETDAVPAAARPEVDASAVGVAISREYNEPALEWWMGRYSASAETPEPLRDAIANWSRQKPEVATQWLAEQPESPQRDALNAAAAPAFMMKGLFPKAAERLMDIRDPELRQSGLERLEILWTAQDPAAAAEWKKTRPPE